MKILTLLFRRAKYVFLFSLILLINQQKIKAESSIRVTSGKTAERSQIIPSPSLVMFISNDINYDSCALRLLRVEGYNVVTTYPVPLGTQLMIDSLNKASIVIIGRSVTSGDIAASKQAWNSLKVPLMTMSQHSSAKDKLGWFNTTNVPHVQTIGKIRGYRTQHDTIFYGINFISGDTMEWSEKPEDLVIVDAATNGNVLVKIDSSINAFLVVRFEPGIQFYPGSCDRPAAPRTFFGTGLNTSGILHAYPLSIEAKKVWLAEVKRMISAPYNTYNPSTDATLASLATNKGVIEPSFDPSITSYTCVLPQGTTSVIVSATANYSCANITGAGSKTISSGTGVSNVLVKAENGISIRTYTINFSVATKNQNVKNEEIKIYPNPAESFLDVQVTSDNIGGKIVITNIFGIRIAEKIITKETIHFDVASLKSGIYFVSIKNKTFKVIKKIEIKN